MPVTGESTKAHMKGLFLQLSCTVRDNSPIPHGENDSLLLHRDLIAHKQYVL